MHRCTDAQSLSTHTQKIPKQLKQGEISFHPYEHDRCSLLLLSLLMSLNWKEDFNKSKHQRPKVLLHLVPNVGQLPHPKKTPTGYYISLMASFCGCFPCLVNNHIFQTLLACFHCIGFPRGPTNNLLRHSGTEPSLLTGEIQGLNLAPARRRKCLGSGGQYFPKVQELCGQGWLKVAVWFKLRQLKQLKQGKYS